MSQRVLAAQGKPPSESKSHAVMLDQEERNRLYSGQLLERAVGHTFADQLWQAIDAEFGPQPRVPRAEGHFEHLTRLRQTLSQPVWRGHARDFLAGLGLPLEEFAIDRFRLRSVSPGAHHQPEAAAVFYAHRDTWYANPQAQINLWMPLHDVSGQDSFQFFPEFFDRAVANDSETFDFDRFVAVGGFQNSAARSAHPRWLVDQPVPGQPVELKAGHCLLFAAAHLHGTLPNLSQQVRFSIDLRLVHKEDHACGRGAPNADNRSRGSSISGYDW